MVRKLRINESNILYHRNWHISLDDLDNGSARIFFVANATNKPFGAIYVDDYENGEGKEWNRLKVDIKNLPHSIKDCKEELDYWGNGWDNQSPIKWSEFWANS